ncbi:MAG: hypothetical protein HF973_05830 [Chloroflexi bacterium]|nr:hypothetical protein [Chloroflexota bacterium]
MAKLRRIPTAVWHLGLVTLFGLPLLTSLMRWTAVPCTHDGHLHYHRVAAMRYAWENGLYFSRWLPDLAFGYGYPFFVYREPTPLYAVLWPHLLGLPLPAATNLFYALTILAAGWFMYLWVRDIFGGQAGLVAAVAYMAAPYVLVDALIRGNAPESLALALFPFLLWAGRRWLLRGTWGWFLTAVLSLAFFSLSHNISMLIFTPVLLVYLAVVAYVRRVGWQTAVLRILALFLLGYGLTIFYSGGALLELNEVTLQQSTTTRNNDFRYNFTSLAEITAPVAPENPNLLNPPLLFRLGWAQIALGALGLLAFFANRKFLSADFADDTDLDPQAQTSADSQTSQSPIFNLQSPIHEQQAHILMMVLATAVFLFMSLPASLPVWENVPLIDFAQFPWRFVGRAALPLAMLAGAPFAPQFFSRFRVTHLLFVAAIALLILEAIPNTYPNICPEESFPTILTVHQYERETGLVGVDPEGSYFPRTVQKRPRSSPLEADYAAGQTPQRFDETVLPDTAVIQSIQYDNRRVDAQINSPQPFIARYLSFAFPGWVAEVDGESVSITPEVPSGLITFPVPAGEHTVTVRWTNTPLRAALMGLGTLAFLGIVGVTFFLMKRRNAALPIASNDAGAPLLLLLGMGLALLLLKTAVINQTDTIFRRPAPPSVQNTGVLQAGELRLDGYNLSRETVPGGETFDIDLAWTAVDVPRAQYQSNVWLAGPDGLLWSDKETQRPRIYEDQPPTQSWQPGQWAWDSREVQTLPGIPPGAYDIVLTLFDRETLQPLTLLDEQGQAAGPTAVIGQITITPPQTPPEFSPQYPQTADLPNLNLRLLGFNQDRTAAIPGEAVLLTFFWEALGQPAAETLPISLLDEAGTAVHVWEEPLPPVDGRLRSQHLLRLPASLDSGVYRFVLPDGVTLETITVTAPPRVFEPPQMDTAVNETFYEDGRALATLTGYTISNLQSPNLPISLTLLWKAENETAVSYRVFVHLLDENGQIIAQDDAEPANWNRPTTGWTAGEYILDEHTLTLPAELRDGPFTLRIGLYDPATGERLPTAEGDVYTIQSP